MKFENGKCVGTLL